MNSNILARIFSKLNTVYVVNCITIDQYNQSGTMKWQKFYRNKESAHLYIKGYLENRFRKIINDILTSLLKNRAEFITNTFDKDDTSFVFNRSWNYFTQASQFLLILEEIFDEGRRPNYHSRFIRQKYIRYFEFIVRKLLRTYRIGELKKLVLQKWMEKLDITKDCIKIDNCTRIEIEDCKIE